MSSLKTLCRVGQQAIRQTRQMASKSSHPDWLAKEAQLPKDLHPMFYKLKSDQKLYQKADGVPVHFKRGARDKILLWITCAGIAVGMFQCGQFVFSLP